MRKALCKNTFCQKPKNGQEQQHLQIFFFHFDFLDIMGRDIMGRNSPFKKQEPHATTVQKRIAYRCTCFFEETMTVIKNCQLYAYAPRCGQKNKKAKYKETYSKK